MNSFFKTWHSYIFYLRVLESQFLQYHITSKGIFITLIITTTILSLPMRVSSHPLSFIVICNCKRSLSPPLLSSLTKPFQQQRSRKKRNHTQFYFWRICEKWLVSFPLWNTIWECKCEPRNVKWAGRLKRERFSQKRIPTSWTHKQIERLFALERNSTKEKGPLLH